MKFIWGGIPLTDWENFPAQNVSVNGQSAVDVVDIVRAAAAKFFSRGNDQVTFQFTVRREFATLRECQVYLATHFSLLPRVATLQIVCGGNGEATQDCFMEGAILSASPIGTFNGVEAFVQYTIQGGAVTTDVPPPFLIGGEEMILRGKEDIANDVDFHAVVFGTAFPPGTTVIVHAGVAKPSGSGSNLFATLRDDLTDENGFTVEFNGNTPDANHKLPWIAVGILP